jgi:hypothetical protein
MGLTLYFVGAGLTKSLERTRRVPLMSDFVQVLTEYASNGNKVVLDTLVGMEVGNAYEAACEKCLALAKALRGREEVTEEERGRFAELVRNRPSESIEAIFKRIESLGPDTPGFAIASGLRPAYFRYAINEVFATIDWDLQLDLLTRFLTKQFEDNQRNHVFVSFNYDLALDRAIELASDGQWQPQGGYGFDFPFFTIDGSQACWTACLPRSCRRIQILKPHGSLNWLRRRSRAQPGVGADDASDMVLPLSRKLELRYWAASNPFQSINFSQPGSLDFGSPNVEILIAPPSPTKSSVMPRLRAAEIDAIAKADEVFVIGYSLPETDQDQRELIKDAIGKRSGSISKLTAVNYIVNDEESARYFKDLENLFQPQSTEKCNKGFAKFAERSACG